MKQIPIFLSFLSLILIAGLFAGCGDNRVSAADNSAPDYSQTQYWLATPSPTSKPVDVFYVYPTEYTKINTNDPTICEINNASMVKGANQAFQRQATAFESVGNIYAPYYRQASTAVLSLPQSEQTAIVGGIPKSDVFAAFDYYIKNYNNGRPFILVGHSQGSNILIFLLSEYMKQNPDVYKRMVAAYVIGYSVTTDYLAENPHLKFAEGADDTGVIISYNTESPDFTGNNPVVLAGAQVINPITWTRDETPATAAQSLGSLTLTGYGTVRLDSLPVMNFADAQINKEKGVIVCSSVTPEILAPGNQLIATGFYHPFDYPLYYYNIKENAAVRTKNFLAKQKK
ncbi:MAG: DUF3089 domain-containing protein [Firmicutes bacterium]|nr:DUF3089 domain-containing protein [Bacillota bacterium]